MTDALTIAGFVIGAFILGLAVGMILLYFIVSRYINLIENYQMTTQNVLGLDQHKQAFEFNYTTGMDNYLRGDAEEAKIEQSREETLGYG